MITLQEYITDNFASISEFTTAYSIQINKKVHRNQVDRWLSKGARIDENFVIWVPTTSRSRP